MKYIFRCHLMTLSFIQLPVSGHAFSFFYSLAFLVAFAILLIEGRRRNFPMLPWILMIVFIRVLFILGSKLTAFSVAEWSTMIDERMLLPGTKKMIAGGLLFGIAGLFIAKRWMHFRHATLDAFAVAVPLGMAIQRLGCFLNGCCYGAPCELPWAVQYPVNTLAHYQHFQDQLISTTSLFSLPVHPAQLYETAGLLVAVALVIFFRNNWKRAGNSGLFSLSLILLIRFAVEFFRDPAAHTNGGAMIGLLNQVQWGMILILPVLVFIIRRREQNPESSAPKFSASIPSVPVLLSFFIASASLIRIFANWFQVMELWAILVVFIPASALIFVHLIRQNEKIGIRVAWAGLLILPFFLMSQSFPDVESDSIPVRKSFSIGGGFASGNYSNSLTNVSGEGCSRVANTNYFNQNYALGGISANLRTEYIAKNRETNLGVNLYFGENKEYSLSARSTDRQQILGLNPYFKFDSRWVGLGVGVHFGQLAYSVEDDSEKAGYLPQSGNKTESIYPQFYARMGPRDILFMDYRLADGFPSPFPGYRQQIGIGTGLGQTNGTSLRVGSTFLGTYLAGNIPIGQKFILEPMLVFNKKSSVADQLPSSSNFQYSISARYVLSQKTKKLARQPY